MNSLENINRKEDLIPIFSSNPINGNILARKVSGTSTWLLCEVDGEKRIHLVNLMMVAGIWTYEILTNEKDFKLYSCPANFIKQTEDRKDKSEEWRKTVKDERDHTVWNEISAQIRCKKNTLKKHRFILQLKDTWSKRAGSSELIPYVELMQIQPPIGRYNNRYYYFQRRAVISYKKLPNIKHLKGLKSKDFVFENTSDTP